MVRHMSGKYDRGSNFLEYAIILGLVTMIFAAMNIYVKRGIQGRIRDLSDYFIAPRSEHTEDLVPDSSTSSTTNTDASTTMSAQLLSAGATTVTSSENSAIGSTTVTQDWDLE